MLVVVVGLQHSPSKVTNKTKVGSTSAEWLVQGTTWRGCPLALVSVMPGGMAVDYCVYIIELMALPCQSSNTHGQGHTVSYMFLPCQSR